MECSQGIAVATQSLRLTTDTRDRLTSQSNIILTIRTDSSLRRQVGWWKSGHNRHGGAGHLLEIWCRLDTASMDHLQQALT